ncbi:TonB-dependent siderophore receptor [Photobacterium profundum]|uniref:Putative putative ferrichrome-iron receptor n=1 Tax=Photobacterium profundum 3TCK TaxID=314280 RepID=Q1YYK7_9GAMM|nr:TonB-dependent siderophore receptor [Photobacterium profundum]EAS41315.1 putative putative ferrichrome-iron receptor [Photobacterium profundum 3TCK]PSV57540.1 TonB-dependent siderophore receptor [Photobacterium profundum]
MFFKSHLTLLIGAILAAPVVQAQNEVQNTASETDEHMVVTGRDYGFKVDTNSTAMRVEATQLETPGQVTVIDEQLIDEQRASTLGDVLKNDSSISAGGVSRNRESFSLRGFSLDSGSSFLRDGKQHWSHYRQPIELLERVEVLKGPAGLLYGKSAPGGLVNMVSKKPTYETQVHVSQDIGSNNESRTIADVSGSLNDAQTLRARAIVSKQSYDSWRSYSDGSTPSTERFVGGLFVDYDVNDDVTVSFHYDKTNDNGSVDSGAYIVDGKPVLGRDFIWDAQWSNIENDVENVGFDVAATLSSVWSIKGGYNHQDFERHDTESFSKPDTYNAATGTYEYQGYDRWDNWQFDTAYIDLVGEFDALGVSHQMLVGANWLGYYYSTQSQSIKGQTATVGQPLEKPSGLDYRNGKKGDATERDSYGIYVQDMITFNDQWQVLAGLRFDREENDTDTYNNILPKAGVIYHPASNGSIYLTYSESFEPKDPINDDQDINNGKALDPVKGRLYELGSKWELMDNQLFVSGAVFEITQENKVISQDINGNPDFESETTQAGKQVHRGAELSTMGYVTEAFSLSGSMMYLDAEIQDEFDSSIDGNRPADVPEFSANVWTRYSFENNTDVNLGAIYVGERFGDEKNTYKKDAYTRFDAGVAHTVKYDENLDIIARFNVENIFDKEYLAGGSQTKTVLGEGRNYMATLQFRY